MSEEIINRVANSDLITIDLTDYAPNIQILELDIKHFLFEGFILKEKDFRASLKEFDFSGYENKVVAVFCSSDCIIPMWAFMLVTSCLNNVASKIYSGNKNTVFQQLFLRNIENIKTLKFKNKKDLERFETELKDIVLNNIKEKFEEMIEHKEAARPD